jgi:hypothetical protein
VIVYSWRVQIWLGDLAEVWVGTVVAAHCESAAIQRARDDIGHAYPVLEEMTFLGPATARVLTAESQRPVAAVQLKVKPKRNPADSHSKVGTARPKSRA